MSPQVKWCIILSDYWLTSLTYQCKLKEQSDYSCTYKPSSASCPGVLLSKTNKQFSKLFHRKKHGFWHSCLCLFLAAILIVDPLEMLPSPHFPVFTFSIPFLASSNHVLVQRCEQRRKGRDSRREELGQQALFGAKWIWRVAKLRHVHCFVTAYRFVLWSLSDKHNCVHDSLNI